MKKKILCWCMMLLSVVTTQAQDFLRLRIINTDSVGVKKATVQLYCNGKVQTMRTDSLGFVNIKSSSKKCKLTITAMGYETDYNTVIEDTTKVIVLDKINSLLNEVVVTGQTRTTDIKNTVQKITSISAAQIKQLGANNLAEVMNMQSNFFIQQDNILGSAINMQGIGGQNIKVLINGVPINGRENGNIDLSQINVSNIERIEIVKGPMSVLYGTDALGGVINIITKQATLSKRIDLFTQYESTGRLINNVTLGLAHKRHSFNINAGRNFFDGEIFLDTFNRAQIWKPKEQYTADANYTFQTSKGKLQYTPIWMKEHVYNRGTPQVDPFGAGVVDEHYYNTRMQHIVSAVYELDKKRRFNLSNSVAIYNRQRMRMYKDMVTLNESPTTNIGDQDTSTFVDYNFRGIFTNEYNAMVSMIVGYDFNICEAMSTKIDGKQKNISDYAFFVNTPIKVSKQFTIQPALRIAYNNSFNTPALPSINMSVTPNDALTIRGAYARGFRAPSLKEMYLYFVDMNHNVTGNVDLTAETGHHLQANIDYKIVQDKSKKITSFANSYFNTIKNQIGLALINTGRNEYQYKNVAEFKNFAQEIGVKCSTKNLQAQVSSTVNHIFGIDTVAGFTNLELLTNASYKLPQGFSINGNYRFISKQAILGISSFADQAYYNTYIPTMHLCDANIMKSFYNNKFLLQLGVRNLLNITSLQTQGAPVSAIHSSNGAQNISPGRAGMISLRYTY